MPICSLALHSQALLAQVRGTERHGLTYLNLRHTSPCKYQHQQRRIEVVWVTCNSSCPVAQETGNTHSTCVRGCTELRTSGERTTDSNIEELDPWIPCLEGLREVSLKPFIRDTYSLCHSSAAYLDTSPSPSSSVPHLSSLCRYLLDRCRRVQGKESLRNPNILEVSLNNAFREVGRNPSKASKAPTLPNPSLDPEPNPPGSLAAPLPALLPQYTHSGCPCVPCLKVVTVNRVQSTYAVPTYSTAGGDLDSLNALCELLLTMLSYPF